MVITHPGCGACWTGTVAEHCPACHLTFGSTRAGDAHRVGEHGVTTGPDRRRCLALDEMRAKRIRRGPLAGEPYFTARVNGYGTEIWVLTKARNTRWDIPQDDSAALAGPGRPERRAAA